MHVASWHETYTGILPDEMLASLSVEARAEMWAKILGDPAAFGGKTVYDHGRVVGFGFCGQQRDEALTGLGFGGEISAIYVLRSHQRLSVGRSIISMMSHALLEHDRTAATLWVLRENVTARGFYERLGGAVVSEKKDERPNATLVELAYGWRDLSLLVR